MRFIEAGIDGAFIVEPEPIRDERGFFARSFCVGEFSAHGLATAFVQHSISYSARRHTLRGLHFQRPPHAEIKLVSCVAGAVLDVIVDLRAGSPTCLEWRSFELTAHNRRQLYIPKGVAHGFQTLCAHSTLHYLISEFHVPTAACGVRYDDPGLAIDWPARPSVMSERDRQWPQAAAAMADPVL